MLLAAVLLVGVTVGVAPDPTANVSSPPALTPETVLASLNASIEWYRQARVTMREVNRSAGALFAQEDQETARQALQRAFAVARARAALLKQAPDPATKPPAQERLAAARAQLEASITAEAQRASRGPARERAAARRRLELDRARLSVMTELQSFNASLAGNAQVDLSQQIDALEQSAPELRGTTAATEPAAAVVPAAGGSGTWGLVDRLIRLHQSRGSVDDLRAATASLSRSVSNELRATAEQLRPLGARLSALAESPETAAAAETREVLKSLGLELLRLSVVIAIVLLGAVVWRVLALRYIADGYRRRLLMTARTFVVTTAIALVIVFHFTSELTPLVTALGFAAAGIAFALQNVILALVGYFAMLSPNGIRVGDRVSLQGPFAYVYGEVMEIGFLRIRLRELAREPPTPTGRIVVFPNSVVFTGTFFKHPDGEAAEPLRRSA
jgi:hypothetical protein